MVEKKKAVRKKNIRKKSRPSKLGHDPLSWIDEKDIDDIAGGDNDNPESIAESKEENTESNHDEVDNLSVAMENNVNDNTEKDINKSEEMDEIHRENLDMLDLTSHFGISRVADIYPQMQSLISSSSETLKISGGDIESVDTAALQLLLAFVAEAEKNGKKIEWESCSEKLRSSASLLNIEKSLGIG